MGATGYARYVRSDVDPDSPEQREVDRIARDLVDHLDAETDAIDLAHVHGASSLVIQGIVAELLRDRLRFGEEVVIRIDDGLVTRPRPDFFYRLADGAGILAEVERGGTTTNNHDLKDMWKAHISPETQHLFLVVPNANWAASGLAREKPFHRVATRIEAFFGDPRREIDVRSAHVFGYGRTASPV